MPGRNADLELSFAADLPLTRAALEFAQERHGGQHREADGADFVAHPVEVASLLERSGYPDHVVATGVLHDVLENTSVVREELREHFGEEVAGLVAAVSDDPSIEDEDERKEELRRRVAELDGDPLAVYAADKISKVRELRMKIATGADPDEVNTSTERYRDALRMIEEVAPGSRLAKLLRFELESLDQLPPTPAT